MSPIDFFKSLFGGKERFTLKEINAQEIIDKEGEETAIRELALNTAANLIAGTVSACEFKTYIKNAEIKKDEYYTWNVAPNPNESAAIFWQKLIHKLCLENEAVVIFDKPKDFNGNAYALIADSFALKNEKALFPNTYVGISSNSFTFDREFPADEVLHFKLHNENVRRLVNTFNSSYKKLLEMSLQAFARTRGERGVLTTERLPGDTDYEVIVREMMEKYFKPYFKNNNAVLPLFTGQTYQKTSTTGLREITDVSESRKLIDDIFDVTARAFLIPPALMRGELADSSKLLTDFLTFCIDPICEVIEDEINAKRYKRQHYLTGTRLKIDTSSIKHVDLLDAATAVDKLISSGPLSVNEVREAIGKPAIDEEWANSHYMTKNYTLIENLDTLDAAGGEGVKE